MTRRQRFWLGGMVAVGMCTPPLVESALAVEMPPAASRRGNLPREPSHLGEREVRRQIEARLRSMRQRHESSRNKRQAAVAAGSRERGGVATEAEIRREPAELSVQPLP